MHTLLVVCGGFALLGVFLLIAKLAGGTAAALGKAAILFVPVWLLAAIANLWIGVSKAGFTVRQELPVLLVVFGIPAAVAAYIGWRFSVR